MSEEREMTGLEKWEKERDEELQKKLKKHMEMMDGLLFVAKLLGSLGLISGGVYLLLDTNMAFGDVLVVLGVFAYSKVLP